MAQGYVHPLPAAKASRARIASPVETRVRERDVSESAPLNAWRRAALVLGPLLAVLTPLVVEIPEHPRAPFMLGILLWMALWWLTECVPLAVTALIPLVAFPFTGIATAKETAPRYMTSIMFLFVGGFLIAQAMERTGLHRRIALAILARLHGSPVALLAGFALTTAFLSMWVSNTATTLLMVTIAMAVLARLEQSLDAAQLARLAPALLLAVAYAANLGGMGTPVGTVPNLVLLENLRQQDDALVPSFLQWMLVGVPMVAAGLAVVLFLFARRLRGLAWDAGTGAGLMEERRALGPMGRDQAFVAWVLGLTALAWLTRRGIQGDDFHLPGWSALLPHPGVDDGTVAMVAALLLFLVPVRDGRPVLDHRAIGRLPWEILILLGGGFALAMGMQRSGLSEWIGSQSQILAGVPLPLVILGVAALIVFLTEVTSNTATTQVMLPILAAVALANGHDLTGVLLAATLAASCAFMLPVATPPNAIVFATGRVGMGDMARAGLRLNLLFPFLILALVTTLRTLWPG